MNLNFRKLQSMCFGLVITLIFSGTANAEKIKNTVAVFSGIDKITGRIITFDVYIDETVQFGALQVTPKVCYSRPSTEAPKTTSFIEVDEITLERGEVVAASDRGELRSVAG